MSQMDREQLEAMARGETPKEEKEPYVPRMGWQRALAWFAVAVVVFAFMGTIYWMINFKL